jgi:hypothetical protein
VFFKSLQAAAAGRAGGGFVMTRDEHLEWAKQRALEYCERGDVVNAWASMVSDLSKHEELQNHAAIRMGMMMLLSGNLSTVREMRQFIKGFN